MTNPTYTVDSLVRLWLSAVCICGERSCTVPEKLLTRGLLLCRLHVQMSSQILVMLMIRLSSTCVLSHICVALRPSVRVCVTHSE
jgi:hypothetical protein